MMVSADKTQRTPRASKLLAAVIYISFFGVLVLFIGFAPLCYISIFCPLEGCPPCVGPVPGLDWVVIPTGAMMGILIYGRSVLRQVSQTPIWLAQGKLALSLLANSSLALVLFLTFSQASSSWAIWVVGGLIVLDFPTGGWILLQKRRRRYKDELPTVHNLQEVST
jgi:hypothetical protein